MGRAGFEPASPRRGQGLQPCEPPIAQPTPLQLPFSSNPSLLCVAPSIWEPSIHMLYSLVVSPKNVDILVRIETKREIIHINPSIITYDFDTMEYGTKCLKLFLTFKTIPYSSNAWRVFIATSFQWPRLESNQHALADTDF